MNFHLSVVMPSDPRFLCVVRSAVTELSLVCGLSDTDSRRIALAIDEALANIIRHAYKSQDDKAIQFKCEISRDCLEFTLLDQGEPADLAKIRAVPLNNDSLSGRGTHIIRLIMDEVSYERVPGGNRLRLRKHLPVKDTVAERE
jgi:anti-sigma regulatory factor (Ser/Thr protein kinase)